MLAGRSKFTAQSLVLERGGSRWADGESDPGTDLASAELHRAEASRFPVQVLSSPGKLLEMRSASLPERWAVGKDSPGQAGPGGQC